MEAEEADAERQDHRQLLRQGEPVRAQVAACRRAGEPPEIARIFGPRGSGVAYRALKIPYTSF
jgi:hypothetical protein